MDEKSHMLIDIFHFYINTERDILLELIEIQSLTSKICGEIAQDGLSWLKSHKPWVGHSVFEGTLEVSSEMGTRAKSLFDLVVDALIAFGDYYKNIVERLQARRLTNVTTSALLDTLKTYKTKTLNNVFDLVVDVTETQETDTDSPCSHFKHIDSICCQLKQVITQLYENFISVTICVGSNLNDSYEIRLHNIFEKFIAISTSHSYTSSSLYK